MLCRLCLVLALIYSVQSFATLSCANLFQTIRDKSYIRTVQLNPDLTQLASLFAKPDTLAALKSLYVALKVEEYRYASEYYLVDRKKQFVSDTHAEHLRHEFSKDFDIQELSIKQLTVFYVNSLRAEYMLIADRIYRLWIQSVTTRLTPSEFEIILGALNRSLSPNDLYQDTLTPGAAAQLFADDQPILTLIHDLVDALSGKTQAPTSRTLRLLEQGKDYREWRAGQLCCRSPGWCWDCRLNNQVRRHQVRQ